MDINNNEITNKQQIEKDLTFKETTKILREFIREREWDKYHTPRNLLMALIGEVGQLAEIFQWKGEVQNELKGFSEQEKTHVGEEISDVLCYLIRLADVSGIDIEVALKNKLEKNRKKYPCHAVKQNQNLIWEIKQQRRIKRQQQTQIKQSDVEQGNSEKQ